MKSTYTHKFTLVHKSAKGGFTLEDAPNKEATMYEGLLAARKGGITKNIIICINL